MKGIILDTEAAAMNKMDKILAVWHFSSNSEQLDYIL